MSPCKEVQEYVGRLMAERPRLSDEQCRTIANILNT